ATARLAPAAASITSEIMLSASFEGEGSNGTAQSANITPTTPNTTGTRKRPSDSRGRGSLSMPAMIRPAAPWLSPRSRGLRAGPVPRRPLAPRRRVPPARPRASHLLGGAHAQQVERGGQRAPHGVHQEQARLAQPGVGPQDLSVGAARLVLVVVVGVPGRREVEGVLGDLVGRQLLGRGL